MYFTKSHLSLGSHHVPDSDDGLTAVVILDVVVTPGNLGDFEVTGGHSTLCVADPSVRQVTECLDALDEERMVTLQQEVAAAVEDVSGSVFPEPEERLGRNGEGTVAVYIDNLGYSVHAVIFKAVAIMKAARRPMV